MRSVILATLPFLVGCLQIAQGPVDSKGNMACFIGSSQVFSGVLDLRGTGAYTGNEDIFNGEWQLCEAVPAKVVCIVQITQKDGGK